MFNQTIPYGRSISVSYYNDGDNAEPLITITPTGLFVLLPTGNEFENLRNVWVASTIANVLQGDSGTYRGVLIPKNDIFTVTCRDTVKRRDTVKQFKLYNDLLVQL